MTHTLHRIWVEYNNVAQLESILHGLTTRNIAVEVLVHSVLVQYELLLTQEELTLLKLSFRYFKIMDVEIDTDTRIVILGNDDIDYYE